MNDAAAALSESPSVAHPADPAPATAQSPSPLIERPTLALWVENVTVNFSGFKALNNLTLTIDKGELRCIIGPNGAGKTTLMDVITGKTRPTEGFVYLENRLHEVTALPEWTTGCTVSISNYEYSYDELRTNEPLSEAFTANLIAAGIPEADLVASHDHGSVDLGNDILRCPVIHPYIKVVNEPYQLHTIPFRDAAQTEAAYEAMVFGATMLANTACDVLTDAGLQQRIRDAFLSK